MGPTSIVSPSRTFVTVPDIEVTCANAPEAREITIPKKINSEAQLLKGRALGLKNSLVFTLRKPGMKHVNRSSSKLDYYFESNFQTPSHFFGGEALSVSQRSI